jgi:hypothetical protein
MNVIFQKFIKIDMVIVEEKGFVRLVFSWWWWWWGDD